MNISKLQFNTLFLFAGLLAGAALISSQAVAQKQLILQTQPDPTVIELQGNLQIDGDGDIRVTPVDPEACTATGSCEDVEVHVSSFTVNSQASAVSVSQGQNLTFRWSTRGAWACDGTGLSGWTGTGKTSSDLSGLTVSTSNVPVGTYQVSLSCYNGSVLASTTPSVAVEVKEADSGPPDPEPVPQICDSRQKLPTNWNRLTTGSNSCSYRYAGMAGGGSGPHTDHDCREFNKVWPANWDNMDNSQRVLGTPARNNGRHYMALGFNSGDIPTALPPSGLHNYGSFSLAPPQTSGLDNRPKLISISRCPGDFDKAAIDIDMGSGCIVREVGFKGPKWGGPHYRTQNGVCALQPNTDYYLNIIYTLSPVGTPPAQIEPDSECATGSGCGTRWMPSG